jgi:hypothetical protein
MRLCLFFSCLLLVFNFTAFAADDPSILYSDDFSTLDPGWGAADANMSVSGSKLIITPNVNQAYSTMFQGTLFDDADASVKVTVVNGTPGSYGGLNFWGTDIDNYYSVHIGSDGKVGVMRKLKGNYIYPVASTDNDAVLKGFNQPNVVRVVTQGKTATVFVNGKQITSFKGFPPASGSEIGMHAESGDQANTWQFSEFVVRKPK